MSTNRIIIAGFGGQGILFTGKFIAYKGMLDDKQVSWLPSYGPEMRGGTACCSVILSDNPVGSPILNSCDILVAMNLPSLDKYESYVEKGGIIIVDSTLVDRKVERDDVTTYYVPATKLASDNKLGNLANMIIVGKLMKVLGEENLEKLDTALSKVVSVKHPEMKEINLKAMEIGKNL